MDFKLRIIISILISSLTITLCCAQSSRNVTITDNIEKVTSKKSVKFFLNKHASEITVKIPRGVYFNIDICPFKSKRRQTLKAKSDNCVLWYDNQLERFYLTDISQFRSGQGMAISLISNTLNSIKIISDQPYYQNNRYVNADGLSSDSYSDDYIYVSSSEGEDSNIGTYDSPVRTIQKAMALMSSKRGVKLKCGDVFYEQITLTDNKELSSYGKGPRPILSGLIIPKHERWERGVLNEKGVWTPSENSNIWRIYLAGPSSHYSGYLAKGSSDVNNIACIYNIDDDTRCNSKKYSHYNNLKENFDFCQGWWIGEYMVSGIPQALDYIYIYLDSDPNDLNLGFVSKVSLVRTGSCDGCIIDGIEMRCANFGIYAGSSSDITIRNCRLDVLGGSTMNGASSVEGEYIRWGNGIEFYVHDGDTIQNVLVENNYVTRVFDAGLTLQGKNYSAQNVVFRNNYLKGCSQNWENFNSATAHPDIRSYKDCFFMNNLCVNGGQDMDIRYNNDKYNQILVNTNSEDLSSGAIIYKDNLFVNGNYRGCSYHGGRGFFGELYDGNVVYLMPGQVLYEPLFMSKGRYSVRIPTIVDKSNPSIDIQPFIQQYRDRTGDDSSIFKVIMSESEKNAMIELLDMFWRGN